MKHYKFGYARVSTEQQNLDRQLDILKAYGADHTYNEKMTGTKRDRPELTKLLDQFERDVIADRTREGLKAARARGRTGGRPKSDVHKVQQAVKLYHSGQHTAKEIEELTGIKRATLYRSYEIDALICSVRLGVWGKGETCVAPAAQSTQPPSPSSASLVPAVASSRVLGVPSFLTKGST